MTEPTDRRRGIYLLPNLFTTAALFAGFYAIVAATKNQFEVAALAIFVAMLLDGIDGRVARLTNTQSDFGAQYDSLADMVSFGLAPALVSYEWMLNGMGKLGWLAAFVYVACAALRLARFNTQVSTADKRYFQGLPSPSAAAIVAGLVWVSEVYLPDGKPYLKWVAFLMTLSAGILMVSRVRYHSFKGINWRGRVGFMVLPAIVLALAFISYEPPAVLFTVFLVYTVSGPAMTLVQLRQRRAEREQHHKQESGPES